MRKFYWLGQKGQLFLMSTLAKFASAGRVTLAPMKGFKHHLSVLFFLATFSVSIRYSGLSSPLCPRDFFRHFSSPAFSNSLVASPLSLS